MVNPFPDGMRKLNIQPVMLISRIGIKLYAFNETATGSPKKAFRNISENSSSRNFEKVPRKIPVIKPFQVKIALHRCFFEILSIYLEMLFYGDLIMMYTSSFKVNLDLFCDFHQSCCPNFVTIALTER